MTFRLSTVTAGAVPAHDPETYSRTPTPPGAWSTVGVASVAVVVHAAGSVPLARHTFACRVVFVVPVITKRVRKTSPGLTVRPATVVVVRTVCVPPMVFVRLAWTVPLDR